ncbi:MAG TPA: SUMF1/EgtB/PvdO family nonheme iron enzyme [Verrucomicrobiae bacterium]|nr:SUMF1/EgtB/PvdO family nonheme iron enzyme [Verrucomicrobiae bacterium]
MGVLISKISRRRFVQLTAAVAAVGMGRAAPNDFTLDDAAHIFPAPGDPVLWPAYREALAHWREKTRARLHYDDALYRRPDFFWAASNYACGFLMTCDETFYDPRAARYTVGSYLRRARREFGGFDSVVLWHAYPRIGVDNRNQFDFYRDSPGGVAGVRGAVRQFHQRGVRVYIDYNPWDTGTRREPKSDLEALADLVASIEADGIFLDTLDSGGAGWRARLDAARPGVILEGEDSVPLEKLHDHHASWAQWFDDSPAPGVLKHKWFERRHMQHQIRRWDHDHTGELHSAWMNGSGMMVWENVFGSHVPWSARDRSMLRAMLPIQRRFHTLFSEGAWTPLVPCEQPGVFASFWERAGLRLWTLVNRSENACQGNLLRVAAAPKQRCFDLIHGAEAAPPLLSGEILPRGVACFAVGALDDFGSGFSAFLRSQATIDRHKDFSTARPHAVTVRSPGLRAPLREVPDGMVEISPAAFEMSMNMRVRECGFYDSTPPPGIDLGDSYGFRLQNFRRQVSFRRFAMDKTLVTNAAFAEFMRAGGYTPRHPENFLKHWSDGHPPTGLENHPVVYVDMEDAQAFARWARKRLPTEEEWQYAAQGTDGRKFPWGADMEANRCEGISDKTNAVTAFPSGRSPFGCYDMCGNVWEWTDGAYSDGFTRFCILRGGANYQAQGSGWYADGGPRPVDFAAKFLLTWPGLDRCATIGFRCAADLPD